MPEITFAIDKVPTEPLAPVDEMFYGAWDRVVKDFDKAGVKLHTYHAPLTSGTGYRSNIGKDLDIELGMRFNDSVLRIKQKNFCGKIESENLIKIHSVRAVDVEKKEGVFILKIQTSSASLEFFSEAA